MENKILPFIIGTLVGAIIATAGWLIYAKVNSSTSTGNQMEQMQKTDGMGDINMQNGNMTEPPSKTNGDTNSTEPPAKPEESTSNNESK